MRERGRFIAIEGGEAAGKTVQARLLAESLDALLTREPGGTPLGERIRTIVLDVDQVGLASRTEALLMAAARAQHVDEVVSPALESGRWVVTDRFSASSLAYQGYGRGLELDELERLCIWASAGLDPDLNVLLDTPSSVAANRKMGRPDRLEAAGDAFHQRVVEGFGALARADPDGWVVIDGAGDPQDIAGNILAAVTQRFGWPENVGHRTTESDRHPPSRQSDSPSGAGGSS